MQENRLKFEGAVSDEFGRIIVRKEAGERLIEVTHIENF